jgi:hypothetical protein
MTHARPDMGSYEDRAILLLHKLTAKPFATTIQDIQPAVAALDELRFTLIQTAKAHVETETRAREAARDKLLADIAELEAGGPGR